MKAKIHVLVGTFNVYQQTLNEQIRDWLLSPFQEHEGVLPDIVAVGFQEFSTYPQAFIQKDEERLEYVEHLIEKSLKELGESQHNNLEGKTPDTTYKRIFIEQVVGLALMVFVKAPLQEHVSDIFSNYEGSGPLFIQNKGALGVKFRLAPKSVEELGGTFCFVCAHFTAHEGYARRRNTDFNNLVQRLVFPRNHLSSEFCTLYEFDHVFLFGDLNYRVTYNFKEITRQQTSETILSLIQDKDFSSLRKYDELLFEKQEGRTVQGFTEGHSLDFPPTYKFTVGTQEYKWKARIPSWCDRILFFDPEEYKLVQTKGSSEKNKTTSPIKALFYSSYSPSVLSDHKPVVGLYEIKSLPVDLVHTKWPTVDAYWKLKQAFGNVLTRATGILWYYLGTERWIGVFLCLFLYKLYQYIEFEGI